MLEIGLLDCSLRVKQLDNALLGSAGHHLVSCEYDGVSISQVYAEIADFYSVDGVKHFHSQTQRPT